MGLLGSGGGTLGLGGTKWDPTTWSSGGELGGEWSLWGKGTPGGEPVPGIEGAITLPSKDYVPSLTDTWSKDAGIFEKVQGVGKKTSDIVAPTKIEQYIRQFIK